MNTILKNYNKEIVFIDKGNIMEKKTILAVDDEIHILELLKYNLETNGYYVITVETGEEALELLMDEKIDAVLLDLMLPKMDGLEVLRRIRAIEKIKKILFTKE